MCVTTSDGSLVHASLIAKPSNSRPATVVTAAVASPATQPSTVVVAIVPVINGGVVSSTLIVCEAVVAFRHASVTVYVRTTTIGHVPVGTSTRVTTSDGLLVHASLIAKPSNS